MAKRKKDKRTNNDEPNTTQKTYDCETRNPIKRRLTQVSQKGFSRSCFTNDIRRVTFITNPVISHEMRKRQYCDYDKRNISLVICDTETQ